MLAEEIRDRAVRLLEEYFKRDDFEGRQTVFNQAFYGVEPDPRAGIRFELAVGDFASNAVYALVAYGGIGRGKHSLAKLIETMAEVRGRTNEPDFVDLPRALDALCALPTRKEEQAYLARLIGEIKTLERRYSPLPLVSTTRRKAANPLLADFEEDENLVLLLHEVRKKYQPEVQVEATPYDDIREVFPKVKQAVLLGEPGAGKSTTLRKLALDLARTAQGDAKAPLPVFASLGNWKTAVPLEDYLAEAVPDVGWGVTALGEAGRLVLLLDGLNEVPTGMWAVQARAIGEFRKCQMMVVSCRQEDYRGPLDLGVDTLTLQRLSRERILGALRKWVTNAGEPAELADTIFWELAGDVRLEQVFAKWEEVGGASAYWTVSEPSEHEAAYLNTNFEDDVLWLRHIPEPRSLLRLAENPWLLTMLYAVRVQAGGIPKNRSELFGMFTAQLFRRAGLAVQSDEGTRLLEGLEQFAWRIGKADPTGVLTVAGREAAMEALGGEAVLKRALGSSILEGGAELRFRHQSLQEYFAARALRQQLDKLRASEYWPVERWWERSGWEETALLLAEIAGEDCSAVVRWLAVAQPEVAARCLAEVGSPAVNEALKPELRAAWAPRLERELREQARAAVGRALGRFGWDGRKRVGLRKEDEVPDIDWVWIEGGEFVYQEREKESVEGFSMARYPVTNAQYDAFLQAANGYRDDQWWAGMDEVDRNPVSGRWTEGNHPRERVSWHEALAFCNWLSVQRQEEVSLPTELEWERAARWRDGRTWPWGSATHEGRANVDGVIGRTSPVGIYPLGASQEGVHELSGNVWEWCLNEYEDVGRIAPGGGAARALRGGSWLLNPEFSRAGNRFYDDPQVRSFSIGFRVVCRSPITGH